MKTNHRSAKHLVPLWGLDPMVDRGQLPAIRIGKSLRFDPADIEAFLDRIRINPPPLEGPPAEEG